MLLAKSLLNKPEDQVQISNTYIFIKSSAVPHICAQHWLGGDGQTPVCPALAGWRQANSCVSSTGWVETGKSLEPTARQIDKLQTNERPCLKKLRCVGLDIGC